MDKIQNKVLNALLDKYEKSKSFTGDNKVNQNFFVDINKMFPKYGDDAEYDFFITVNNALEELVEQNILYIQKQTNGIVTKAILNVDYLDNCYKLMGRIPRKQEHNWLLGVWKYYEDVFTETHTDTYTPLIEYIQAQKEKIIKNNAAEYYDGNYKDYEDLLKLVKCVCENQDEIFIRDFSIHVFQDSKRVEQLKNKVQSLLYQYGEYEEKDYVLEECGIVHTPTYVAIKGNGQIKLAGQIIDLSKMNGDIALSTASLKEIEDVKIFGDRIVTIENLTSFHDYNTKNELAIYLGGFHNRVKRKFITYLYSKNKNKSYNHFGDIDAGGFYILEHLKDKTGIAFNSLYMDVETLKKYNSMTKELTANDKNRLNQLLEMLERKKQAGILSEDYRAVIKYMIINNCKLEQEAVNSYSSNDIKRI